MARRAKPQATMAAVKLVQVDARRLVTVRPDAPLWQMSPAALDLDVLVEMKAGPIVRLQPPAGAADDLVAAMADALRAAGAVAVRLMAAGRGEQPVAEQEAARAVQPSQTPRQAVMAMVEAATADKKLLAELCGQVMDREGL